MLGKVGTRLHQLFCENTRLKAQLKIAESELANVSTAIDEIRSWYPTDMFPEDGESLDCKSAKMARITCDNIKNKIKELSNGESNG